MSKSQFAMFVSNSSSISEGYQQDSNSCPQKKDILPPCRLFCRQISNLKQKMHCKRISRFQRKKLHKQVRQIQRKLHHRQMFRLHGKISKTDPLSHPMHEVSQKVISHIPPPTFGFSAFQSNVIRDSRQFTESSHDAIEVDVNTNQIEFEKYLNKLSVLIENDIVDLSGRNLELFPLIFSDFEISDLADESLKAEMRLAGKILLPLVVRFACSFARNGMNFNILHTAVTACIDRSIPIESGLLCKGNVYEEDIDEVFPIFGNPHEGINSSVIYSDTSKFSLRKLTNKMLRLIETGSVLFPQ